MGFSVDHSQANSLLPEGEYECIIEFARQTTTRNGTPFINIPLIIRKDVADNPKKAGKIFHSLWMKKEPTPADNACDGYSSKQIQSLSKAAGLPNGKSYANMEEWCADLAGKPIRVTVYHDEYKGNVNARVSWTNETKHPNVAALDKETHQAMHGNVFVGDNHDFAEIQDDLDDVPF